MKELKEGNSNVSFSWHIVANRKNISGKSENENSLFSDLRFPNALKYIQTENNIYTEINDEKVNKYVKSRN